MRFAIPSILVCLLLVLSGCATSREYGGQPEESLTFSSASDKAILIVGQRSTTDKKRSTWFGRKRANWGQSWLAFDPETKKSLRPQHSYDKNKGIIRVSRVHCGLTASSYDKLTCEDDRRQTHYAVLLIKPGHYILRSIGVQQGGYTVFTNERESELFGNTIADNIRDGTTPWFFARPGEIVYVGNLVLDIQDAVDNLDGYVKLVGIERDDEAARRALDHFPNIKGELIYRGPQRPLQETRSETLLGEANQ